MLAASPLVIGIGTGLVFVPIFDFFLGAAATEEVGTGSGMLNAVQQFDGAFGTAFFARVGPGGTADFDDAGMLVAEIAAVLRMIIFTLVWLLPSTPSKQKADQKGALIKCLLLGLMVVHEKLGTLQDSWKGP